MGKADQLAKRIFTEETPLATGHRVYFLVPPEVPVGALQPDGVLGLTAPPIELASLAPPWNRIRREVTADVKMPGDHSGRPALSASRKTHIHASMQAMMTSEAVMAWILITVGASAYAQTVAVANQFPAQRRAVIHVPKMASRPRKIMKKRPVRKPAPKMYSAKPGIKNAKGALLVSGP